jgi:hypothetical protein
MTPKEQTIAMSKACGWIQSKTSTWGQWWYRKKGNRTYHPFPPDYIYDLNLMHAAWLTLPPSEKERFESELYSIVIGWSAYNNNDDAGWITNATASQRAEAFLKTLDLWKL